MTYLDDALKPQTAEPRPDDSDAGDFVRRRFWKSSRMSGGRGRSAKAVHRAYTRPARDGTNPLSLVLPNGSRIVGLPWGIAICG